MILAFTSSIFCQTVILLDYYANKTAYAENCINKARPKMHCNGKCQMMKKLQEEEKKEQQLPERKFENKVEIFSSESFYYSLTIPVIITEKATPLEIVNNAQDISLDFFHPPQV